MYMVSFHNADRNMVPWDFGWCGRIFNCVEKAHTKVAAGTWKIVKTDFEQAYNIIIKDCDNSKSTERWRRKAAGLQRTSYGSRVAEEIIDLV